MATLLAAVPFECRVTLGASPGSCSDLQLTAFHEAGHAVARLSVGLPVARASIVPAEDSLGRIIGPSWQPALDRAPNGYWRRYFAGLEYSGLMAGPMAAAMRLTQACAEVPSVERVLAFFDHTSLGQSDRDKAQSVMRSAYKSADTAEMRMFDLTYGLIASFALRPRVWACVEAVATALLEYRELPGVVIEWLVRKILTGSHYLNLRGELFVRMTSEQPESP